MMRAIVTLEAAPVKTPRLFHTLSDRVSVSTKADHAGERMCYPRDIPGNAMQHVRAALRSTCRHATFAVLAQRAVVSIACQCEFACQFQERFSICFFYA